MFKLWAAILKDFTILIRDKAGLAVMFAMPILLVVVITSIQNSTFKLVNENKIAILVSNRDGGESSVQVLDALSKIGMFDVIKADSSLSDAQLKTQMAEQEAMIGVTVPKGFTAAIKAKSKVIATKAISELGMEPKDEGKPFNPADTIVAPVTMYYNPVLQESFRFSVQSALRSAQQFVETRQILQSLYFALNNKGLPTDLEKQILNNQSQIAEIPASKDGSRTIPNATQHNVPAWTIFAMFFIVVSLSTSVVKEKLSGSFIRLKTLPTNYLLVLGAKQLTYIGVTLLQVLVIFSLGIFLFPAIGLPKLELPAEMFGLLLVSLICGWCAVSYGVALGVYAKTIEQAIGFGAVSVVILAAIGGIIVPAFAMPDSLKFFMQISPMHWCMEAYYELFLKGGGIKDVLYSVLPLLGITFAIQIIAIIGLKRQHLI
jgi:ABC-2 type transport system permease protein